MSQSMWLFYIFILSCTICPSLTVDKSNFKTCDQSAFCKRHRDLKEGSITYTIVPGSISVENVDNIEHVVAKLQSSSSPDKKLKLTLSQTGESGDILRVHITEVDSQRGRYEATEALAPTVKFTNLLANLDQPQDGFAVKFGQGKNYKAIVYSNPFKIEVFNGDKLTLTLNQRQLLKFEHHRQKTEQDNNELGEWEETFKSHTDSKPYGPMSVGMDINFINIDHVYGIPEHADAFSLKNTRGVTDPYRLYNLDVFEYELDSPASLYGAVPFMVGHSADQSIGVYWLNPSETWIDIESIVPSSGSAGASGMIGGFFGGDAATTKARSSHWISETGVIDVWILAGPTPSDIAKQNAYLFGTHPLPPYYSIGYHQCRWNYFTQEEVAEIDSKFDEHDIPLDAIWLDVEYTEGRSKKYFTWDPVAFSDYKGLISNLTTKGRRLITIIDPHLKRDSSFPVYNEAVEKKYLIKNKDGSDYDGWCWPGSSSWPDYLNPDVCEWWANKFDPEFFPGFPGGVVDIWNDMNEPSVFNGPEITAPKDLLHYNGLEHRDVHNIYGLLMTKATFTGLARHRSNLRSFILTRSFFAGSQRYCAAWTGDNMAKFEHLKATIPMMLSLNLAGMAFSGADVPGFFYNPEPELVVRWYQAGAFQPFFRAHGHIDTKKREPWMFDEETKKLIREAIRTRYTYLPYMYTLFYENHINGTPIMRPLWYHFSSDVTTFSADESYLLGSALLVHPVTDKGLATLDVYLPGTNEDTWLDIEGNHVYTGGHSYNIPVTLSKIPYFQRGGSILPKRERIRRSAAITLNDPLTIDVLLDSNGNANGTLYLDDGNSLSYTKGQYLLASLTYSHGHLTYKLTDGKYDTDVWIERVYIRQINWKPSKVKVTQGESTEQLEFKQPESDIIVIRKPGVKLTRDWVITIG